MKKKKETKYSNAGKGDKSRVSDSKRYADNWDKIFKKEKKLILNILYIGIYL